MKNLWKGFIVGGALGAAIGIVADGGSRARREIVGAASELNLGARAHDLGERAAHSDTLHQVSDRIRDAAEPAAAALRDVAETVTDRIS